MIGILIGAFAVLVAIVWLCVANSKPSISRVRKGEDASWENDPKPAPERDAAGKAAAEQQGKNTTTAVAAWWWLNHNRGSDDDSSKGDQPR